MSSKQARLGLGLEWMRVRWRFFLAPTALGVVAAIARILSFWLFIPLVHGMVDPDYSGLGRLTRLFPGISPTGSLPPLSFIAALIGVCTLIHAVAEHAAKRVVESRRRHAQRLMTELVARRVLSFGQAYFDSDGSASSANRLRKLPKAVARLVPLIHRANVMAASLAVYWIGMVLLSPLMGAVALGVLLAYWVGYRALTRRLDDMAHRIEDEEERETVEADDLIRNIRLTRLAGTAEEESRRFVDHAAARARLQDAQERWSRMTEPLSSVLGTAVLLVFLFGSSVLLDGLGPGEIVRAIVFFVLLRKALSAFGSALKLPSQFDGVRRSVARLAALMDSSDKGAVESGTRVFDGIRESIQVENVRFSYTRKNWVLRNLRATIRAGQTTVLVGRTGSGKSTFLSMLLREYEFAAGSIRIDGHDLREFSAASLRRATAFAGCEPLLWHDTVRQNLTYGVGPATQDELVEAAVRAQALEFIEALPRQFDTVIGDRGSRLSHGERQRLALARLFLQRDAKLIVLDEALSAVDSPTEAEILREIRAIAGATVILVNHRLSIIDSEMDVLVFDRGRVVDHGTRQELLAHPGIFRRMWKGQGKAFERRAMK